MPIISTFFGIVIRMYYQEHGAAHFHAEFQGEQAVFGFDGEPIAGSIRSATARQLIRQWAAAHRGELEANWTKMKGGQALERIAPLEWPRVRRMASLPVVREARYCGGYRLHLTFGDGLEATVDFEDWLRGPVFEPLLDTAYFQRFFLDGGTVAWPNGADIAPETLHERAAAIRAA